MKNKLFIIVLLLTSNISFSQDIKIGVEISPSFKLQSIRNKSTGLTSSFSGYGFNFGVPIKIQLDDDKSVSTGITYEFSAFDNKVNNFLISSTRFNSINIPVTYNYPIINNFNFNAGIGINYFLTSKEYGGGVWISSISIVNRIQPYLSTGLSTLIDRNDNTYELGINARYHLINLWKYNTQTSTNLIAIDLNMKYYF